MQIRNQNLSTLVTLILTGFFMIAGNTYSLAQEPDWDWVKTAGGNGNEEPFDIATDNIGNVYVTGSYGQFTGSSINFGNTVLSNAGLSDMFIAKYNSSGALQWVKSAGGSGYDYGKSVAIDGVGNIYLAGFFESSSITFGTTTLTQSPGAGDIFIVKYSEGGTVIWAKKVGGNGDDRPAGIIADKNGNVFMCGDFESNLNFGSNVISSSGYTDVFVLKFNVSGSESWIRSAGGAGADNSSDISVDGNGNVYFAGSFASQNIKFGSKNLQSKGSYDIFAARYNAAGDLAWAKSYGGTGSDVSKSIANDQSGNFYLAGSFDSPEIVFGSTTLQNAMYSGMYLVKCDENGAALWANSAGSGFDVASSVVTDEDDNVYLSGYFSAFSVTFGSTKLYREGSAYSDIFVVKYATGGAVLWAKSAGGVDAENESFITSDKNGNIYLTGYSRSSNMVFGAVTTSSAGNSDIYIAKLVKPEISSAFSNEQRSNPLLEIYPNPSDGIFTIGGLQNEDWKIEIFTLSGNCVHKASVNSNTSVVDLSSHAAGLYFYRLYNKSGNLKTGKIVVE